MNPKLAAAALACTVALGGCYYVGPYGYYPYPAPPPVATQQDQQYGAATPAPVYAVPAYPAYYPAYPAYYGWPGWWGPSVSIGFGFRGGGRGRR